MKMDKNGYKWKEMDKNGPIDQNGPKWPQKGQKYSNMLKNDKKKCKLPKTTDKTGKGMSMTLILL